MRPLCSPRLSALFFILVGLVAPACGDGSQQDVGPDFSNDGSAATDGGNLPGVDGASDGAGTDSANTQCDSDRDCERGTCVEGICRIESTDGGNADGVNADGNADGGNVDGGNADGVDAGTDGTVTVTPKTMVVYANGTKIGYVWYLSDATITVYSPSTNLLFGLNDQTGFVAGSDPTFYASPGCADPLYWIGVADNASDCTAAGLGRRRTVYVVGGNALGTKRPSSLLVGGNSVTWRVPASARYGTDCQSAPSFEYCVAPTVTTTAIPTAFPLPIEIRDE